eukprot:CAMPEP_0172487408 /NCGR_PEP_ID=MMETSP1066-20121228/16494_1 /TAXON_ID=671091 /ORGANISM="Coscinodiscus wailesii, Strain CCMP2513" /LENGTH=315 /DNA_ID=CAMNT_0013254011 /DNA_START=178 /DNA_END=1125 /DNA_ORIENTATION=-
MATSASAFVPTPSFNALSKCSTTHLYNILDEADQDLDKALGRRMEYKAGAADSEFAKRFGDMAGKKIKTVGEAFSDFTNMLGSPINALYKNMMTDIVGTLHLILVNARFQRDGIFSLGLLTSLELLLRNYPEQDIKSDIISSLFKSVGLDEEGLKAEAKVIEDWAKGKSKDEIAAALKGEGDSPVAEIAKVAKGDEFWMYSRYFGIGLIRMMELSGVEMDSETCYPIMEEWVGTCLGKPYFTACNDNDTYFKVKGKLDMMETLMKEVEIREKKRLAQRLEEKAEAALRKADKEAKLQEEVESETEQIEAAEAASN